MPEPEPNQQPSSNTQMILMIVLLVMQMVNTMFNAWLTRGQSATHDSLANVENRQAVQEVKTEAVKETLDNKAKEDVPAKKSMLLVNWTYLANEAAVTGLPADRAKAIEAKRLYDEFLQKHP